LALLGTENNKLGFSSKRKRFDLCTFDGGQWWELSPHALNEKIDRGLITFDLDARSEGIVPNSAGQSEFPGQAMNSRAKPNSLNRTEISYASTYAHQVED
jgi:hypothetical protein